METMGVNKFEASIPILAFSEGDSTQYSSIIQKRERIENNAVLDAPLMSIRPFAYLIEENCNAVKKITINRDRSIN